MSCTELKVNKTNVAGNKTEPSNVYPFSTVNVQSNKLRTSHLAKTLMKKDSICELPISNDSIEIYNFTHYNLEDIVLWTCNYLGIRNVWINIGYLYNQKVREGVVEPGKMIMKGKHGYNLYLKRNMASNRRIDLIVIHELVHIKQYEFQKIGLTENINVVTYEGKKINLSDVPYNLRRFEEEAHRLDGKILNVYYKERK